MAKKTKAPGYVRTKDFFAAATKIEKTQIAENVKARMRNNRNETILDTSAVRRQEAWSLLADKAVGAEADN